MNILITGAAGGIGSTLTKYLNNKNHNLILVDNLRSGNIENIQSVDGELFGVFYNIDIRDKDELSYLLRTNNIEVVIHLAAIASLPECETLREECFSINVGGTVSVIEACKENNIRKIIYTSTSGVYEGNDKEDLPFTENLDVYPSLCYTLSKKMAEDVCISYIMKYGMNIQILRLFNVISPNLDMNRKSPALINYLIDSYANGVSPIIHTDGNISRDYIFVDDIINLIEMLLHKDSGEKIMNVSNNELLSIDKIINIIKDEFKSDIKPIYEKTELWKKHNELFEGDFPLDHKVVKEQADKIYLGYNNLALRFGWKPKNNIEESIRKTVKMFINNQT